MSYFIVCVICFLVAFLVSRFMVKKRVWAAAPNKMCIGKTSSTELDEMRELARKALENDQEIWKESKYKISKILDGNELSVKVEDRGCKVFAWFLDGKCAFKTMDDNWSENAAITLLTIL